jgi:hypothetical protein
VPSLDLRFADNKILTDAVTGASLVTFTRASDGTFVDSAGVLQTAVTDVPRFDHNPTTGESLGLLVEEQRTNSIRNNTMVGAVDGTPGTLPTNWSAISETGGLTREIIGTGASNGITYIDIKYSGTTTDSISVNLAFDGNTAIAASTGQSWTSSAYVTVVGGSFANITSALIRVVERTAVGSLVGSTSVSLASASGALNLNRFSTTRTLGATAGAVQGTIFLGIPSGVAIDITLRIGLPQLEQGAFATSPIPTTTAAVTRSADVVSITGSAFSSWFNASTGAIYGEASNAQAGTSLFGADDGTASNRIFTNFSVANSPAFRVVSGGVDQAVFAAGTITQNATFKLIAAYATNDFAASLNGAVAVTDTSGTVPSGLTTARIGSNVVTVSFINGHIRRLAFWGQRLPNNILQSITQ